MPTPEGGETIGERLDRYRTELVRARAVIENAESNGQSFNVNGTGVTQIAYEQAQGRIRELESKIANLEIRLRTGGKTSRGIGLTVSRMS
jgi:hypothetical protein